MMSLVETDPRKEKQFHYEDSITLSCGAILSAAYAARRCKWPLSQNSRLHRLRLVPSSDFAGSRPV